MRKFGGHRSRIAVSTALALAMGGIGTPTLAGLVQGGGKSASDCYVEFDVEGRSGSNKITCQDGEVGCDTKPSTDGTCDKVCTFKVALCVNQADPALPDCQPKTFSKPPKVSPGIPLPTINGTDAACGVPVEISVPLKKNGKKKGKRKLKASVKALTKPKSDKDALTLICLPRTDSCPTTTTSTTTTSTTTSTTLPSNSLAFTTSPGATSCGGGGLNPAPSAPFSGEIDSDTAGTTKVIDLGTGCLYIGGGQATAVPPSKIPDGATNLFTVSGSDLLSSTGTSPKDCTKGAGPGRHCANNNAEPACTGDGDCGGSAGSCALDANCFFGPPLPIPNPALAQLTTCVLNVIQTDASGTSNTATGESNVTIPLSSRVYLSGNLTDPCPKCISGQCDPTWVDGLGAASPDSGHSCTPTGTLSTTTECRPPLSTFQAPLPVTLTPLTTGTASMTASNGIFCPSGDANLNQAHAGAFGKANAQRIAENGSPAGDLTDNQPHPSTLAATFCIPKTNNAAVDGLADLPGPGAIGLIGTARLTQ